MDIDKMTGSTGSVAGMDGAEIYELDRRLKKRRALREALSGYLFTAPSVLILVAFWFVPTTYAFFVSFYRWDFMNPVKTWVGFGNYTKLLTSGEFWHVMGNTVYYMVGAIPLAMFFALILAMCINEKLKFLAFFRTATFAPVVASVVAMSAVWLWMYDPINGLLNYFLKMFGIGSLRWLTDTKWAMPSLIIFDIWKHTGYDMIIYLAGLQSIPDSYYEAAKIDGADGWQRFRRITWPLLGPTTLFILIISVIQRFQVFSMIHTMTKGGPVNATNVIVFYLYEKAFVYFEMGYAFAVAYVLFLIIFLVTVIQWKVGAKKVHYGRN